MKTNIVNTFIFVLLATLSSCKSDFLNYFSYETPSVDQRFATSMEYNNTHGYAVIKVPDGNYRIFVCTDTHLRKTANNFRYFIQQYHDDFDCPVAVNCGDLVESDESYDFFMSVLNETPAPAGKKDTLFVTPGNHDIFFSQWFDFVKHWPTTTYYFTIEAQDSTHTKDLYISLDSAHGTLGKAQMNWLKDLLESSSSQYRHIIVFTHVNLFRRDNANGHISNFPIEESTELMGLFTKYNVKQVWTGHDHTREKFSIGGVTYIIIDRMKDLDPNASYMILHVSDQLENTFHKI